MKCQFIFSCHEKVNKKKFLKKSTWAHVDMQTSGCKNVLIKNKIYHKDNVAIKLLKCHGLNETKYSEELRT